MTDTAPETWWNSDIMEEAGREKFLAIAQEVKRHGE